MKRIDRDGLKIDSQLVDFIENDAIVGTGVAVEKFWAGFAALVHEFGPKNRALIETRAHFKRQMDEYHIARRGKDVEFEAYKTFLEEIGYLLPEGPDFQIETADVDPEIATKAGPQLVVPITNARYALNAANARWGSLYDAVYGSDVLGSSPQSSGYLAERGEKVIAFVKSHLDQALPLAEGSWSDVTNISLSDGAFHPMLKSPEQFKGFSESPSGAEYLFEKNGLGIVLQVFPATEIGQSDPAGLSDVILESAVSVIMDCEDSVAAVDTEDKILAYSNWLGLMKKDLSASVSKGGKKIERKLRSDRVFQAPGGEAFTKKARALMLVRNVGLLMTTHSVLDRNGDPISEGLMDAMITTLIALHDRENQRSNSATGAIYIVQPKMHGPDEVSYVNDVFSHVEAALGLPQYTVKLGIMDEERRTSLNLKSCIRAAKNRVAFINTGFLDRTGDELHSSMEMGPFLTKADIKKQIWFETYEAQNVEIGLACGLKGKAQIGKGMWAMPDQMASMIDQKMSHPKSGASTAWVPSPTAATLHALHYHLCDVHEIQDDLMKIGRRSKRDDLLVVPVSRGENWSEEQIISEVENNAQGILGYVVRWINQGVGCSKVPDINDVGLMEDRATCRISSQHIANWLHHGVVSETVVLEVMKRMAERVDTQNADDPSYTPMGPGFDGIAFRAACDLVFEGTKQPSGYTEPLLHSGRLEFKSQLGDL